MQHSTAPVGFDAFSRRFALRAAGRPALPWAEFMELALYDPEVGYYRSNRPRVGRAGADFYTAASLGTVFGELVVAAASSLLRNVDPGELGFVEIGAEPGRSVLDGIPHPFRSARTLRVGEPLELEGKLVVFSNELFDAQPFHRVVGRDGAWRELGVRMADRHATWVEVPEPSPEVAALGAELPPVVEGYVLDLPLAAEQLARAIAGQSWTGVFLAFDYGRTWNQLITEYPEGTGRAYSAHRQSGDLLAHPGEQDLTCHVCWDWLERALRDAGFTSVTRESQESFFVRRATTALEQIVANERTVAISPRRSQLHQLLHPALLGQKFEALWAVRG